MPDFTLYVTENEQTWLKQQAAPGRLLRGYIQKQIKRDQRLLEEQRLDRKAGRLGASVRREMEQERRAARRDGRREGA